MWGWGAGHSFAFYITFPFATPLVELIPFSAVSLRASSLSFLESGARWINTLFLAEQLLLFPAGMMCLFRDDNCVSSAVVRYGDLLAGLGRFCFRMTTASSDAANNYRSLQASLEEDFHSLAVSRSVDFCFSPSSSATQQRPSTSLSTMIMPPVWMYTNNL
jgi:hypothetical protein